MLLRTEIVSSSKPWSRAFSPSAVVRPAQEVWSHQSSYPGGTALPHSHRTWGPGCGAASQNTSWWWRPQSRGGSSGVEPYQILLKASYNMLLLNMHDCSNGCMWLSCNTEIALWWWYSPIFAQKSSWKLETFIITFYNLGHQIDTNVCKHCKHIYFSLY